MSLKNTPTTLEFVLLFVLVFANSFVVTRFFTDDEYNKVTLEQASIENYEYSSDFILVEDEEEYSSINKDVSKKTNDVELIDFPERNPNNEVANFENNTDELAIEEEIAKVEFDSIDEESTAPLITSRASTSREYIETNEPEEDIQVEVSEPEPEPAEAYEPVVEKPIYSAPVVPAGQVSIGTIQIPRTGVDMQIFKKVSVAGMETGACVMYSSGSINESGTTVLVSHNYCNGKLFSNNKYLSVGDTITITANGITKVYTIYDTFITSEEDISYIERNTTNEAEIALSTCTNNEEKRLVILAK